MWKVLLGLILSALCSGAAQAVSLLSPGDTPSYVVAGRDIVCREDVFAEVIEIKDMLAKTIMSEQILYAQTLMHINARYAGKVPMCIHAEYLVIVRDPFFRRFNYEDRDLCVQRVEIRAFIYDDIVTHMTQARNPAYIVTSMSHVKRR